MLTLWEPPPRLMENQMDPVISPNTFPFESLLDPARLPSVLAVGVHQAAESIMVTDTQGCILYVNPSFERVSGWTARDALGQNPRILKSGKQPREFYERMWNAILAGVIYRGDVVNRRRNGEFYVEERSVTPVRGPTGGVLYFISVAQDVTERRHTEAERDQWFRESLDLLAVADARGRLKRVNPAWERALGRAEEDLLGKTPFWLMHPDDRKDALGTALKTLIGEPLVDTRMRFLAADGSERWFSWNVTPANDGYTFAVGRDVTEIVAEQEEQKRKLEASERAANHDPLTGLMNRRAWTRQLGTKPWAAIAVFDIDHFKHVNDTYGHLAGDEVLREVASRVAGACGEALVARIGGEEFAVAFTAPILDARRTCEEIIGAVARGPVMLDSGEALAVTVSGGLAPRLELNGPGRSPLKTAFEEADSALYEAKRSGRNRLVARGLRAA